MNWVKYGGIQERGQLLNGWMDRGILGEKLILIFWFSTPILIFDPRSAAWIFEPVIPVQIFDAKVSAKWIFYPTLNKIFSMDPSRATSFNFGG